MHGRLPLALGRRPTLSARLRRRAPFAAVYAVLGIHALLTLFPLVWVLSNSFRKNDAILTSMRLIPESLQFSNYLEMLHVTSIPLALFNSLTITLASLALLLASPCRSPSPWRASASASPTGCSCSSPPRCWCPASRSCR